MPNGFDDRGSPTNFTIFAQPYREEVVLAVAQIYQDRAGFHTVRLMQGWLVLDHSTLDEYIGRFVNGVSHPGCGVQMVPPKLDDAPLSEEEKERLREAEEEEEKAKEEERKQQGEGLGKARL